MANGKEQDQVCFCVFLVLVMSFVAFANAETVVSGPRYIDRERGASTCAQRAVKNTDHLTS